MNYLLIALRTVQWFILWPINFAFGIVAAVCFNWWLPFVAVSIEPGDYLYTVGWDSRLQRLPHFLKWFDTFDASIDAGWHDGYFGDPEDPRIPSYWLRKWYQVRWLYRNTAYGFAYWLLGIDMDTSEWRVICDTPNLFIAVSTSGYWQVTGPKFNFGWKAHWYWLSASKSWQKKPWGPQYRTQIVCSITPSDS